MFVFLRLYVNTNTTTTTTTTTTTSNNVMQLIILLSYIHYFLIYCLICLCLKLGQVRLD